MVGNASSEASTPPLVQTKTATEQSISDYVLSLGLRVGGRKFGELAAARGRDFAKIAIAKALKERKAEKAKAKAPNDGFAFERGGDDASVQAAAATGVSEPRCVSSLSVPPSVGADKSNIELSVCPEVGSEPLLCPEVGSEPFLCPEVGSEPSPCPEVDSEPLLCPEVGSEPIEIIEPACWSSSGALSTLELGVSGAGSAAANVD